MFLLGFVGMLTEFGWNLPINGMQTRFSWNSRDRKGICPLVIKRGSDRFPIMEVLYGKSDSQSPHLISRRYQCFSWNLPTYFYIVIYLYIYTLAIHTWGFNQPEPWYNPINMYILTKIVNHGKILFSISTMLGTILSCAGLQLGWLGFLVVIFSL